MFIRLPEKMCVHKPTRRNCMSLVCQIIPRVHKATRSVCMFISLPEKVCVHKPTRRNCMSLVCQIIPRVHKATRSSSMFISLSYESVCSLAYKKLCKYWLKTRPDVLLGRSPTFSNLEPIYVKIILVNIKFLPFHWMSNLHMHKFKF